MPGDDIPPSMRAQLLERFDHPESYVFREDVPTPQIQHPLEVLVQVQAASFCHTDELLRTGQRAVLPKLPFIGCHEFAGVVAAVGSEVSNFQPGDQVGVPTKGFHSCGSCGECMWSGPFDDEPGYSVYCPSSKELGLNVPGGFADYAVTDSRSLVPIPPSMSPLETAPLMCAGLTVYSALRRCKLVPSKHSVGILGAGGGLGHLGLQFAEKMELDVVAIEAADGPLALANEVASTKTLTVDARKTSAAEAKKLINQKFNAVHEGLDAVLIMPESQNAFDYGMELLKRHGICMLVSVPQAGFHMKPADIIRRDITILGTQVGSVKMLREMMLFADKHGVRSRSRVFPFQQLNKLVQESHATQGGKYVLDYQL